METCKDQHQGAVTDTIHCTVSLSGSQQHRQDNRWTTEEKKVKHVFFISQCIKFPQVCLCLSTLDLPLLSDIYYCPWSSLKPLSVSGLLLEKVQPFYIKVVTVMGTKLMTLYPVPEIWCEPLLLFIDNAIHNSCLYVCKVCVSVWHWLFRSTFCRSLSFYHERISPLSVLQCHFLSHSIYCVQPSHSFLFVSFVHSAYPLSAWQCHGGCSHGQQWWHSSQLWFQEQWLHSRKAERGQWYL